MQLVIWWCHNLALPQASLDHPSGNYCQSSEADQGADNDQSTTLPSAPLQLAALTRLISTEIPPTRWPCLVPRELRLRIIALPLNFTKLLPFLPVYVACCRISLLFVFLRGCAKNELCCLLTAKFIGFLMVSRFHGFSGQGPETSWTGSNGR